jgi:hypothetical protein
MVWFGHGERGHLSPTDGDYKLSPQLLVLGVHVFEHKKSLRSMRAILTGACLRTLKESEVHEGNIDRRISSYIKRV